jgi:Protein of unknown function (DUF3999)
MTLFNILILSLFCLNNALAASFNFDATGSEPLYQTTLPKEIYQASHRDNLEDLTILNSAGEKIPYAILPYETLNPNKSIEESYPLKIFSIQNGTKNTSNQINIDLNQGGNTSINLTNNQALQQPKMSYLFDLGKKHPMLKKIKVDWQGAEGKLIAMQAFTSNNLKDWTNIGQSVLFKKTSDEQTILQNTIELYAFTDDRYLQIRPSEIDDADFKLISVNAEYNKAQNEILPQLWQMLTLLNREQAQKGVINIDYESLARYPANYLRIDLPQLNTITNVKVLTRNQPDAPWEPVINAPIYRVNKQGRDTVNPDIKINPKVARFWRLQFDQSNGGIGAENPTLSIGWLAKTVIWNARGKAPFTLHLDDNTSPNNAVSMSILLPDYTPERIKAIQVANLSLTNNEPADKNVSPWVVAPDYKRWLLWAGLALGVLLLAGMAYSLLKNQHKE